MEISHYYSTPTLKAKLLNLVARRNIARDTQATLNRINAAIEERGAAIRRVDEIPFHNGTMMVHRMRLAPGEAMPWHRDPCHRVEVVRGTNG